VVVAEAVIRVCNCSTKSGSRRAIRQDAVPIPISEVGECVYQEILPLVATEAPTQIMWRGRPGRAATRSTPRATCTGRPGSRTGQDLRRVHSLVTTTPAARRSTARSGALRAGINGACRRRVANGMCSSTVIRIRPVCGNSCAAVGRGDEPVDQDGLAVGDGGNDAGQVGAGARPGTGHAAATVATSTSQPASASPAQTRRS